MTVCAYWDAENIQMSHKSRSWSKKYKYIKWNIKTEFCYIKVYKKTFRWNYDAKYYNVKDYESCITFWVRWHNDFRS